MTSPLLLLAVALAVLYVGGQVLRIVFSQIENYQRTSAAESRNNGMKRSWEKAA